MPKISAVIITLNEEKNIERCIQSLLRVADDIVVVDSYSTDKTEEISKRLGARFVQHPFHGYRDQKNFATEQAAHDIVLSLDADEALSIELEKSILEVKNSWKCDAYKFNRLNFCCGQWIKHTDWYPDCKIRLFDRRKGAWSGDNIHETIRMSDGSKGGFLEGDLLHWTYNYYEQLVDVMNKYSTLSAKEYFARGKKPSIIKLVFSPFWRFIHSYILRRGFLDGYNGYFISVSVAKLSQLKYVKLRQLYLTKNLDYTSQHPALAKDGIRIGLDAKRAFYNRSGLGNYSRNLIDSLVKLDIRNTFHLFTPKTKKRIFFEPNTEENINIITSGKFTQKLFGSLWRSRFIVRAIKKQKVDIYHGLSHELPIGIHKSGAKSVVTIHDLIFLRFPEFYGPINVYIYKKKVEYACRVANKIVAISSQTRDDLVNFLKVDPNKIEVIYQSCNAVYQSKISNDVFQNIKQKYKLPEKYLLYVGTIEERKNLLNILKGIKAKNISMPLVVVGRKADYFHKTIKPFIAENKIEGVIFPEKLTDQELAALYQNAQCFIYPSLFEGFGIPILEALTSGIPVITSKGSCFEETGGLGSIYVDPHNPSEIGDAIVKVTTDNELRAKLIEKGIEHAKLFLPETIALQFLNLYKSLL